MATLTEWQDLCDRCSKNVGEDNLLPNTFSEDTGQCFCGDCVDLDEYERRVEEQAQAICKEWNATHKPGFLSRKAEYSER